MCQRGALILDVLVAFSGVPLKACADYATRRNYTIFQADDWEALVTLLQAKRPDCVLIVSLEKDFSANILHRLVSDLQLQVGFVIEKDAGTLISRLNRLSGSAAPQYREDVILRAGMLSMMQLCGSDNLKFPGVDEFLESNAPPDMTRSEVTPRLVGLLAHSDGYSMNIAADGFPKVMCGRTEYLHPNNYMQCFSDGFCTRLGGHYSELQRQRTLVSPRILKADIALLAVCFGFVFHHFPQPRDGSIGDALIGGGTVKHILSTIGLAAFSPVSFLRHFEFIQQNVPLGAVARSLNQSSEIAGGPGWVVLMGDPKARYDEMRDEAALPESPCTLQEAILAQDCLDTIPAGSLSKMFWSDVSDGLRHKLNLPAQDATPPPAALLTASILKHGSATELFTYAERGFTIENRGRINCPFCDAPALTADFLDPKNGYRRFSVCCPSYCILIDAPETFSLRPGEGLPMRFSNRREAGSEVLTISGWDFAVQVAVLEVHPRSASRTLAFQQKIGELKIHLPSELKYRKGAVAIIASLDDELITLRLEIFAFPAPTAMHALQTSCANATI